MGILFGSKLTDLSKKKKITLIELSSFYEFFKGIGSIIPGVEVTGNGAFFSDVLEVIDHRYIVEKISGFLIYVYIYTYIL